PAPSPSHGDVGEVRGDARRRRPRRPAPVEKPGGQSKAGQGEAEKKMRLAVAVLVSALSAPLHAADKLTLGFMTTLSGPAAVVGNDIRDGMRLALDHLNNRVGGLPTTVLVEDDRQKPEVAVE